MSKDGEGTNQPLSCLTLPVQHTNILLTRPGLVFAIRGSMLKAYMLIQNTAVFSLLGCIFELYGVIIRTLKYICT